MKNFYLVISALMLLTSCTQHVDTKAQHVVELYMEEPVGEGRTMQMESSGLIYQVSETVLISQKDILDVDLAQVDMGYCLLLHLSQQGRQTLEQSIKQNLGRSIILMVDGKPVGARKFKTEGFEQQGLFMFTEWENDRLESFVVAAKSSFSKQTKIGA